MNTVTGDIGEIGVSARAQKPFEELPDVQIKYTPGIECERGRPDIVITLRDEGISLS